MADLLKVFRDIGEAYRDEALQNYNQIDSKNIGAIAVVDVADSNRVEIVDKEAWRNRLFLRVTSSNGGNLYPFFFYSSEKLKDALKKSFKNLKAHLKDKAQRALSDTIEKVSDAEKIKELLAPYENKENLYLALSYKGKSLYELFPETAEHYADEVCAAEIKKEGSSYFDEGVEIGYDAGLNFCSVNEMPAAMRKQVKYRLLPLGHEDACLVRQGFIRVFEAQMFRFSLFGLSYYLLPTLFLSDKRAFFDKLAIFAERDGGKVSGKSALERRLERWVARLEETGFSQRVLFSFLFAHKQNSAIDLHHLIEDVAPSRIAKGYGLMNRLRIEEGASRFYGAKARQKDALYLRDYIEEGLLAAKLFFGKERIGSMQTLLGWIYRVIFYGDNRENLPRRELSKVLGGYYAEAVNFAAHQRFLDFLQVLGAVGFETNNYLHKEERMESAASFSKIAQEKFETVELLRQKPRAREFYVLGALAKFVIAWQFWEKKSSTLEKYLDSIGSVSMQNADRVFRKIYEASRKYGMSGVEYDDLMALYAQIKESLSRNDTVSLDAANIAFVMGGVDFKRYKENKPEKEEKNDG